MRNMGQGSEARVAPFLNTILTCSPRTIVPVRRSGFSLSFSLLSHLAGTIPLSNCTTGASGVNPVVRRSLWLWPRARRWAHHRLHPLPLSRVRVAGRFAPGTGSTRRRASALRIRAGVPYRNDVPLQSAGFSGKQLSALLILSVGLLVLRARSLHGRQNRWTYHHQHKGHTDQEIEHREAPGLRHFSAAAMDES